jgi:hypothetical protein
LRGLFQRRGRTVDLPQPPRTHVLTRHQSPRRASRLLRGPRRSSNRDSPYGSTAVLPLPPESRARRWRPASSGPSRSPTGASRAVAYSSLAALRFRSRPARFSAACRRCAGGRMGDAPGARLLELRLHRAARRAARGPGRTRSFATSRMKPDRYSWVMASYRSSARRYAIARASIGSSCNALPNASSASARRPSNARTSP